MQPDSKDRPPRWAEQLLRVLLKPRDRDTVAGDLLEEYREVVLPERGRFYARLWYLRQAISIVDGVILGVAIGALFGVCNLIVTGLNPLLDDTPVTLLAFYGPMFTLWAFAGFGASRRTGRLFQGVKVGATVAFVTFIVFDLTIILRVNLFLEAISRRADWQNLLQRYRSSGFNSLRTYANYVYITGTPLGMLLASSVGAITGLVGGVFGNLSRRQAGT